MADFKVADQFSGLDMTALIGGPLKAAADAQALLSNSTASFIENVGLEEADPNNPGAVRKVRTTSFSFTRVSPGEADENGTIVQKQEEVTMNVPFLSIVNIPSLAISDVDVSFDMEVKSSTTAESTSSKSGELDAKAKMGFAFFKADISIKGSISSSEKNTRSTDNSAKYHVSVKARDKGMPEGLSRMLDIIGSAVAPTNVEQKAS